MHPSRIAPFVVVDGVDVRRLRSELMKQGINVVRIYDWRAFLRLERRLGRAFSLRCRAALARVYGDGGSSYRALGAIVAFAETESIEAAAREVGGVLRRERKERAVEKGPTGFGDLKRCFTDGELEEMGIRKDNWFVPGRPRP